jgi:hypothetical protein
MPNWSKWQAIESVYDNTDLQGRKGLYQIRMVDSNNQAIPIPRLRGIDTEGVAYIGQSVRLRKRIEDFLRGYHSGGGMYYLAYQRLKRCEPYRGHSLQIRFMVCTEADMKTRETNMLRRYFRRFCELPPFNSTVPGGK